MHGIFALAPLPTSACQVVDAATNGAALVLPVAASLPRRERSSGASVGGPSSAESAGPEHAAPSMRAWYRTTLRSIMARPRNSDSAVTWEVIVAAARDELSRGSDPDKLTLRGIASTTGLSLGSVQYYFESKEALLEACHDSYYEELIREAAQAAGQLAGAADFDAEVERVVRTGYRFALRARPLLRLRALSTAKTGRLPRERDERVRVPILDGLARLFSERTGRDLLELQLAILSVTFVVVRYALLDEDELRNLAGASGEAAYARVEDHLVTTARALVGTKR